jgi:3-oxoacyl-[acyl-carrier-protein] synthase-1
MPHPITPLRIRAYTACSALGRGRTATLQALRTRQSGLRPNDITGSGEAGDRGAEPTAGAIPTWIGRVAGLESERLPAPLAQWECRNNRLAWLALTQDRFVEAVAQARERYGAARIAVLLGTSTSSIGASEEGYRRLQPDGQFAPDLRRPIVHTPHSTGDFVQHALQLAGPCATVATACSSSAKVFAQAERLLRMGFADAAVVGGVDTLCSSVLYGFNALELMAPEACRPFDRARRGISLGEAGGFALLERDGPAGPWLLGYGESSDAHHMSAPHPGGAGAETALRAALASAGVAAAQIDYINLHGTATQKNDEVEARLVSDLFPARTRASSTKGWTGHTLGAAGILESVITLLALENGFAPGTLNSSELDLACGPQIRLENTPADLRLALNVSFGFGGSNCALLFGRERVRR